MANTTKMERLWHHRTRVNIVIVCEMKSSVPSRDVKLHVLDAFQSKVTKTSVVQKDMNAVII